MNGDPRLKNPQYFSFETELERQNWQEEYDEQRMQRQIDDEIMNNNNEDDGKGRE